VLSDGKGSLSKNTMTSILIPKEQSQFFAAAATKDVERVDVICKAAASKSFECHSWLTEALCHVRSELLGGLDDWFGCE
jgi:hypothetical protein